MGYVGTFDKKMEATLVYLGYTDNCRWGIFFRLQDLKLSDIYPAQCWKILGVGDRAIGSNMKNECNFTVT